MINVPHILISPANRVHEPVLVEEDRVTTMALPWIKVLGLILTAAGIGFALSVSLVPAIALFVAGAAALLFGFALSEKGELSAPFGRDAWIQFLGDPGEEPPLPDGLEEILASSCPFWQGKTVGETHALVLIPGTVTRIVNRANLIVPLSLKTLDELVRFANGSGFGTTWDPIFQEHGEEAVAESYWVLLPKDLIPGSRNKSYADQVELVEQAGYEVASCLEVAVLSVLEHFRSGKRLFPDVPPTYARCREETLGFRLVVGNFSPSGFSIGCYDYDDENVGIAAIRRA